MFTIDPKDMALHIYSDNSETIRSDHEISEQTAI